METTYNGEPVTPSELLGIMLDDLANDWPRSIPVGERLPEVGAPILFFDEGCKIWNAGVYSTDGESPTFGTPYSVILATRVTHWLPLPPKPE